MIYIPDVTWQCPYFECGLPFLRFLWFLQFSCSSGYLVHRPLLLNDHGFEARMDAIILILWRTPFLLKGQQPSSMSLCSPICSMVVRDIVSLFQHINVSHIAQRCFPDADFLELHRRRLCSACGFAYDKWFRCHRSLDPGRTRCRGVMVSACSSYQFAHVSQMIQQECIVIRLLPVQLWCLVPLQLQWT